MFSSYNYTPESVSRDCENEYRNGFDAGRFVGKNKAKNIIRELENKYSDDIIKDVVKLIKREFDVL